MSEYRKALIDLVKNTMDLDGSCLKNSRKEDTDLREFLEAETIILIQAIFEDLKEKTKPSP